MTQGTPKKKYSIVYGLFKPAVVASAWLYYRRFVVSGARKFPSKGPVMLVSNHQNAMMDAIMCCVAAPRQLHFLTRADIFKSPVSNRILRHLNMLPVYRPRDGRAKVATLNQLTFDESEKRIAAGNVISAFPEGNHSNKRAIRPLKKGVARIALRAMKSYNLEKLNIVPVGLDYSNYENFRTDLYVNFGDPIDLDMYREQFDQDETMAINNLTSHIAASLRDLVIDIRRADYHDTLMALRPLIESASGKRLSARARFKAFQQGVITLSDAPDSDFEKLKSQVDEFRNIAGANWEQLLKPKRKVGMGSWLYLLLFSPVILLGLVANLIPALFIKSFVKKNIKDPHFRSSIKIGMAIFVFPLFWMMLALLTWFICTVFWAPLLALVGPFICGIFALQALDVISDLRDQRILGSMSRSQQLSSLKDQIKESLANLLKH